MDHLEQENHELREEVTNFRENFERLNAMMEVLVAAQSQPPSPPPPPQNLLQRTMISEIIFTPIPMALVNAPQHQMPSSFP